MTVESLSVPREDPTRQGAVEDVGEWERQGFRAIPEQSVWDIRAAQSPTGANCPECLQSVRGVEHPEGPSPLSTFQSAVRSGPRETSVGCAAPGSAPIVAKCVLRLFAIFCGSPIRPEGVDNSRGREIFVKPLPQDWLMKPQSLAGSPLSCDNGTETSEVSEKFRKCEIQFQIQSKPSDLESLFDVGTNGSN